MSPWVALVVWVVVHVLGLALLRGSGTWADLFGPVVASTLRRPADPLSTAPRGWIENHEFWDLSTNEAEADHEVDEATAFWGERQAQ